MKQILCTVLLFVTLQSAHAIIGIAEIPLVFGELPTNGPPEVIPPKVVKPVFVYEAPSDTAKVISTEMYGNHHLQSSEFTYELEGALVYAQKGSWYQVKLKNKTTLGWVRSQDIKGFRSLVDLLKDGLDHTTPAWDGRVYEKPFDLQPWDRIPAALIENMRTKNGNLVPVRYKDSKTRGNRIWIQVEILSENPCDGKKPSVVGTVWIPAQDAEEKPTLWFYSRGC